jgi:DNA-binding NarL/FixJ family response regulator
MPVLNGLEAAARLRSAHSRTKIIFLTIHGDPDFVAAAFSAGASAYVMKNHLSSDLVAAIREALQGHTFISHSASGRG